MTDFSSEDFAHTATLLRSGREALVSATLSNNFNVILAALDFASGTGISRLRFMRRVVDGGYIKLSNDENERLRRELDVLRGDVLAVIGPILQGPAGIELTSEQCKQLVLLEDRLSRAQPGQDDVTPKSVAPDTERQ